MMWFVIDFAPDEPVPLYQIVPKKNKNKKHISSYDGLHVLNNHITILPNNPAGLWGVVLGQILAVIQITHFHAQSYFSSISQLENSGSTQVSV